jgi:16S rRNA (cytosine967-C5)-methyltransferase
MARTAARRRDRAGAVPPGRRWSDAVLDSVLRCSGLSGRDAALCTRLCMGVAQNEALCDFYIDCYSSVKTGKLEPKILTSCGCPCISWPFWTGSPATPPSARRELAKKQNLRAAGLVNAVLRRLSENLDALPEVPGKGTAEYLSVRYSHPLWLCKTLIDERGYAFTEALLCANNAAPHSTAQVNTLKISTEALTALLQDEGVACVPAGLPDSLELTQHGDLRALESFQKGLFYIQDNAARLAVLTADPRPGMRVHGRLRRPRRQELCRRRRHGGAGGDRRLRHPREKACPHRQRRRAAGHRHH